MATIDSVKLPDNSTYDLTDTYSGYQTETLATPITVDGTSETTVEGALGAVNDYADKIKGSMSNENLLDNPFFTVNERGQSSYTDAKYSASRWIFAGINASTSTLTVDSNGIKVVFGTGETGAWVKQFIKSDSDLVGKTVTLSMLYNGTVYHNTGTWVANTLSELYLDGTHIRVKFGKYNGQYYIQFICDTTITAYIRAVKLELGSISTLANDVAPDYALELAKCQTSTADPSDTYANQGQLMTSALQGALGAKNINSYPYIYTSKSDNGLTFTDNGDGTVTVSGLANATTNYYFHYRGSSDFYLKNGTYTLNGCPASTGDWDMSIQWLKSDSTTASYTDTGSGVTFTINEPTGGAFVSIYAWIKNGANISTPIIFKPMLRDARVTDDTFVPFAMTNKQLTEEIKAIKYKKVNINFASTDFEAQSGGLVAYKNIATDVGGSVNFDGCFVSQIDGVYSSCCCAIRGIDSSTTYLVAKTFDPSAPNVTITVLYH